MAKTINSTQRKDIELQIKNKNFSKIYLLSGEEAFYIDYLTDKIINSSISEEEKDFNLSVYYGSDVKMSEVVLACRRYPMMAERQVVVLKEAQSWKSLPGVNEKREFEILESYAKQPTPTTILIVCYKGSTIKSAGLTKALTNTIIDGNPVGTIFESKALTEYNITGAINEYVRLVGCTIDDKANSMLAEYVGCDMSHIAKEVDKLKLISPNGVRITPEMVEKNIGASKDYNNFEFIKAIASRDVAKTFKIANYFKSNSRKNPTAVTTALLFNLFSNLLIAYYARTTDERVLMEQLRFKTPYQLKDIHLAKSKYNARQTFNIICFIRDFDAKSKGVGSNKNEYELLEELCYKIFSC